MTVVGKIVLESGYNPVPKESAGQTTINKEIGLNIKQVPLTYKPLSQTSLLLVPVILHVKPCPSSSWIDRTSSAGSWPNETTDSRFPAVLFVGLTLQSCVHLFC